MGGGGANWQEYLGKVPDFLSSTKVNTPLASSVFEHEMTMNCYEVFYYGNLKNTTSKKIP